MYQKIKLTGMLSLIALMALGVSGCVFKPYVPPVEQGTLITPAMQKEVQLGMSQDQVKAILGTPDIQDPYHPDIWYYVQTSEKNHQPMTEKAFKLKFNNDQLVSFSPVSMPAGK